MHTASEVTRTLGIFGLVSRRKCKGIIFEIRSGANPSLGNKMDAHTDQSEAKYIINETPFVYEYPKIIKEQKELYKHSITSHSF